MIEQQMAKGGWAGARILALPIAPPRLAVLRQHGGAVQRTQTNTATCFERLKARPSFARVMKEAEPYFQMVPKKS